MIYLIGGAPKCGKTTLAKALARELGVSWISADTIQNIVKVHTPTSDYPEEFPASAHRGESNDERFSKQSAKTIIEDYTTQAKSSYAALNTLVETYLVDEDDFIIEGYQVTPELVHQIYETFGRESIRAVFLVKMDPQALVANIHKTTTPNDWILRRTQKQETFPKIAAMITEYSKMVEKEARTYQLPVVSMDKNFAAQMEKAKKMLLA